MVPEDYKMPEDEVSPERTHNTMMVTIQFSDLTGIDTFGGAGAMVADTREYNEIGWNDRHQIKERLELVLQNYNDVSKKPMDLCLFDFAITHTHRICRVLKMREGNCLLIGLGGSGR